MMDQQAERGGATLLVSGDGGPHRNPQTSTTSPAVGRLLGELRGHQGEVPLHLQPQVGLGDAAVVRVDGVDASHLPGDQSERKHTNTKKLTFSGERKVLFYTQQEDSTMEGKRLGGRNPGLQLIYPSIVGSRTSCVPRASP